MIQKVQGIKEADSFRQPAVSKNVETQDAELDVLQRRIGDPLDSASKIGELAEAKVIRQTASGTFVAARQTVEGATPLNRFLAGFRK
jgi:hypothetical protein